MEGIWLRAFAKINYALEVHGLRDDGYHEIRTVMQSVSLADEVMIERARSGFGLRVEPEGTDIGPSEKNSVYLAWRALCELAGQNLPVRISLRKTIPAGAGLGGGSADAAATLHGLNGLYELGLLPEELGVAGGTIGADVPFCALGGTMLGEGVGDELTPLPSPPAHRILIAKPEQVAETAAIYRAFDELPRRQGSPVDPVIEALRMGDLSLLGSAVGNDLAPITCGLVPEVADLERELLDAGALGSGMSGTGTAVYGLFASESDALDAARRIGGHFVGTFDLESRGFEAI